MQSLSYSLLRLSCSTGIADIGALIFPGDHPRAKVFIDMLQCLLLFGIIVICSLILSALMKDRDAKPSKKGVGK